MHLPRCAQLKVRRRIESGKQSKGLRMGFSSLDVFDKQCAASEATFYQESTSQNLFAIRYCCLNSPYRNLIDRTQLVKRYKAWQ